MSRKYSRAAVLYFSVSLIVLSFIYFRFSQGIVGDGLYYYSYAVSLVWDGDLDLKNQFDHPLPQRPGETVANGNYFVDHQTGKAFSLFNPGTGILMVPMTAAARVTGRLLKGGDPDPHGYYCQSMAGYTTVLLTSFALLGLFLILKRFFSYPIALLSPFIFLVGTNWLFYSTFLPGWSHAYALSLLVFLIWSFFRLLEKDSMGNALLFGLSGGLLFTTRNLNGLIFFVLLMYLLLRWLKEKHDFFRFKKLSVCSVLFFSSVLGALPQLMLWLEQHGHPFTTSVKAASLAHKPFGFLESPDFHVLELKNLYLISASLFSPETGLIFYHPLYLIGFAGLVWLRSKHKDFQRIGLFSLFIVILFWFVDAAYFDSWFNRLAGAGFGHRRFIDFLPIFIFGAAYILEKSRLRQLSLVVCSFIYSTLAVSGAILLYHFVFLPEYFYEVKYSFFALQKSLLLNAGALVFIPLLTFLLFIFARKIEDREKKEQPLILRQNKYVILSLCILVVAPFFILKPSPDWERKRFIDKKGFFLMYSLNSYVHLPSSQWSWPDEGKRTLKKKEGEIILPCRLKERDAVLFKITSQSSHESRNIMEFFLGDRRQGSQALAAGEGVYTFLIDGNYREGKKLRVRLNSPEKESIFFHEGRVIFREQSEPPFGFVDEPKKDVIIAKERVDLRGWALDDRGVRKIAAERYPLRSGEEEMVTDGLILVSETADLESYRPDVEKVYVLYPDIKKCGWTLALEEKNFPTDKAVKFKIFVFAYDGEGNKALLGRRTVIWKNRPS